MMMRLVIFVCFWCAAVLPVHAQCNCAENFEFVYNKIKINYAGWQDKTSVDPKGFEKLTAQQRQRANAETNKNYCYKIIEEWLTYFRDQHTHLYNKSIAINFETKSAEEIRKYFSGAEKISISEDDAIRSFSNADGIEGIWQMVGGNYRVAIIRNKTSHRDFAGVVLKADSVFWVPGQVKMELTAEGDRNFKALFYMRDHSMRVTNAIHDEHELKFDGLNTFRKIYPEPEDVFQHQVELISEKTELKNLDKSTLYFRIPTFNHLAKNVVDSLIDANYDIITETPNLIIDVRGNGGGSDVTYGELIQFIYTNKITVVNNSIWSSEDNIQKFQNILDDPNYPGSGKGYIRSLIKKLKANPNTFVRKEDNVIKRGAVLSKPENIIILINRNCASSCEEFILVARQSKKVTLMGEYTRGVLDYANVHQLDLPCQDWGLQYATSRTNRLPEFPIDNIGVPPEVYVPKGKNWVELAMEYLKNK